MSEELRVELLRIGETAPTARVSPDTWGRARTARRRVHVIGVTAAILLIAVVGGAITLTPDRGSVQPAGTTGLGVPDRFYPVPGWV